MNEEEQPILPQRGGLPKRARQEIPDPSEIPGHELPEEDTPKLGPENIALTVEGIAEEIRKDEARGPVDPKNAVTHEFPKTEARDPILEEAQTELIPRVDADITANFNVVGERPKAHTPKHRARGTLRKFLSGLISKVPWFKKSSPSDQGPVSDDDKTVPLDPTLHVKEFPTPPSDNQQK